MTFENGPEEECVHDRYNDLCHGLLLTPEALATRSIIYLIVYRRHFKGGGLVATNSYVADHLSVPVDFIVGPQTCLEDDRSLSGIDHTNGDYRNGGPVSRWMTEEDWDALFEQKERLGLPTLEDDAKYVEEQLLIPGLRTAGDS